MVIDVNNIETIKDIYNRTKKVSFKFLSLEYIIEEKDNTVCIYSTTYTNNIRKYSNLDSLLENFYIYGNNLIENGNKIMNIKAM